MADFDNGALVPPDQQAGPTPPVPTAAPWPPATTVPASADLPAVYRPLPSEPTAPPSRYGRIGRVPWTIGQTLLGAGLTIVPWLLLIFASQLLTRGNGGAITKPLAPAVDAVSAIVTFLFDIVVEGAFLLAPLTYAVWRRNGFSVAQGWYALGIRRVRLLPSLGWVVGSIAFMLAIVYPLYSFLIDHFHLPLHTNADALVQQAHYAPLTVLSLLISAVVIAPFCEELFFRGYLFAGLLRGMNVWLAGLISAVLFTLVHGDLGSAALLFVFGLVLAVVRWRSGSLWPGVALHALNNALAAADVLLLLHH